ncbi:MAG: hypothetical protein FWE31_00085 [Firmicutes bacterium]|nr:hypothetical protein [Bacillota bacterium]
MNLVILSQIIGSRLHDEWRITRLLADGTYDPRWKTVKDKEFGKCFKGNLPIFVRQAKDGFEIDIANATFEQLSKDWQHENLEAGKVIADIICAGYNDDATVGDIIHNKWLERNRESLDKAKASENPETKKWAEERDKPFRDLTAEIQQLDLSQFKIGVRVYDRLKKKKGG